MCVCGPHVLSIGLRVLVALDSPIARSTVASILQSRGMLTDTCAPDDLASRMLEQLPSYCIVDKGQAAMAEHAAADAIEKYVACFSRLCSSVLM